MPDDGEAWFIRVAATASSRSRDELLSTIQTFVEARLENLQASYTMIDEPEEEVGITRREKGKAKQLAEVKAISDLINICFVRQKRALGLGHAEPILTTSDLMGYGWPDLGEPVLSDCDIDALAFVFAWALEGSDPYPPAEGPYDCSLD